MYESNTGTHSHEYVCMYMCELCVCVQVCIGNDNNAGDISIVFTQNICNIAYMTPIPHVLQNWNETFIPQKLRLF